MDRRDGSDPTLIPSVCSSHVPAADHNGRLISSALVVLRSDSCVAQTDWWVSQHRRGGSSGAVADGMKQERRGSCHRWGGGGDAGVLNANGHTLPCYELRQRWMPALPLSWMLEEDSTDCAPWHHAGKYDAFPWQRISWTRHFQSLITILQTPLDTFTILFTHM